MNCFAASRTGEPFLLLLRWHCLRHLSVELPWPFSRRHFRLLRDVRALTRRSDSDHPQTSFRLQAAPQSCSTMSRPSPLPANHPSASRGPLFVVAFASVLPPDRGFVYCSVGLRGRLCIRSCCRPRSEWVGTFSLLQAANSSLRVSSRRSKYVSTSGLITFYRALTVSLALW